MRAEYVPDEAGVDAEGTTTIINMTSDPVNHKLTFVSMSTVPEGCTIVFAGLIATDDYTVAHGEGDSFNTKTAKFVRGDPWDGTAYQYSWTKSKVDAGDVWYVRACLIYTDTVGNQITKLGPVEQNSYTNE